MNRSFQNILLSLFVWMTSAFACLAQTFSSSVLEQAANQLKLNRLDTLPEGYSFFDWQDLCITVIKHNGRIDHIGRQLFSPVFRLQDPLPAYDYLEFAYLEQSVLGNDNLFKYKDVFFAEGSWQTLHQINHLTPCTVSINDGRHYEVCWQCNDNRQVTVKFPVSYEIISTATRGELETCFISDLRQHHRSAPSAPVIDPADVKQLQIHTPEVSLLPGDKYLLPSINSNTYFRHTPADATYQLVCDTAMINESIANAICSPAADWKQWIMEGCFHLHNDKQEAISVALTDFADFCRSQGCLLYWGLEEITASAITGTVIAYNSAAGYTHVIRLEYPRQQKTVHQYIKADVSLFVPITNIRDLYRQYNPDKKKIRWQ